MGRWKGVWHRGGLSSLDARHALYTTVAYGMLVVAPLTFVFDVGDKALLLFVAAYGAISSVVFFEAWERSARFFGGGGLAMLPDIVVFEDEEGYVDTVFVRKRGFAFKHGLPEALEDFSPLRRTPNLLYPAASVALAVVLAGTTARPAFVADYLSDEARRYAVLAAVLVLAYATVFVLFRRYLFARKGRVGAVYYGRDDDGALHLFIDAEGASVRLYRRGEGEEMRYWLDAFGHDAYIALDGYGVA